MNSDGGANQTFDATYFAEGQGRVKLKTGEYFSTNTYSYKYYGERLWQFLFQYRDPPPVIFSNNLAQS